MESKITVFYILLCTYQGLFKRKEKVEVKGVIKKFLRIHNESSLQKFKINIFKITKIISRNLKM